MAESGEAGVGRMAEPHEILAAIEEKLGEGGKTADRPLDGVRVLITAGPTHEPIDPVAGHIPGSVNHPWQEVSDENGRMIDPDSQREHWGDSLSAEQLVVYCGSGVTACVNLFSLAMLGRDDAILYAGSWSDWCSYL